MAHRQMRNIKPDSKCDENHPGEVHNRFCDSEYWNSSKTINALSWEQIRSDQVRSGQIRADQVRSEQRALKCTHTRRNVVRALLGRERKRSALDHLVNRAAEDLGHHLALGDGEQVPALAQPARKNTSQQKTDRFLREGEQTRKNKRACAMYCITGDTNMDRMSFCNDQVVSQVTVQWVCALDDAGDAVDEVRLRLLEVAAADRAIVGLDRALLAVDPQRATRLGARRLDDERRRENVQARHGAVGGGRLDACARCVRSGHGRPSRKRQFRVHKQDRLPPARAERSLRLMTTENANGWKCIRFHVELGATVACRSSLAHWYSFFRRCVSNLSSFRCRRRIPQLFARRRDCSSIR